MIELGLLKARLRTQGNTRALSDVSASDVAQEAVLRMLEVVPAPSFESQKAFHAYLWKVAYHLVLDRLRRRRGNLVSIDSEWSSNIASEVATSGGLGEVDRRDLGYAVRLALELLDPEDHALLKLQYDEGLGLAQVAERLTISIDAANMRLVRARRQMHSKVKRFKSVIE